MGFKFKNEDNVLICRFMEIDSDHGYSIFDLRYNTVTRRYSIVDKNSIYGRKIIETTNDTLENKDIIECAYFEMLRRTMEHNINHFQKSSDLDVKFITKEGLNLADNFDENCEYLGYDYIPEKDNKYLQTKLKSNPENSEVKIINNIDLGGK